MAVENMEGCCPHKGVVNNTCMGIVRMKQDMEQMKTSSEE